MRLLLAVLFAVAAMSARAEETPKTALVIHGGAGVIERSALSAEDELGVRADLERALDAGNAILAEGGNALDAVEAAIRILEDSPRFNAGKGAVFDADGGHQLDASVMEGHTRRAGAVAGVRTVRHPISLARAVMEESPHVMLAGAGAERFADTLPAIERVPNDWFDTPRRRQDLERVQQRERDAKNAGLPPPPGTYFGTVGAVALDRHGHIAAATSTGGMTNKKWNRIGDSLAAAAEEVVNKIVPGLGGDGGAIALDRDGNIAMPFNTSGMYRAWIRPDGSRGTAIFRDEGGAGEGSTGWN